MREGERVRAAAAAAAADRFARYAFPPFRRHVGAGLACAERTMMLVAVVISYVPIRRVLYPYYYYYYYFLSSLPTHLVYNQESASYQTTTTISF